MRKILQITGAAPGSTIDFTTTDNASFHVPIVCWALVEQFDEDSHILSNGVEPMIVWNEQTITPIYDVSDLADISRIDVPGSEARS